MDEFHFYAEPDRGWAWQVPLLELPHAQFLLMSATLGDVSDLAADLTRRTGRETAIVDDAERPVPLTFTWALTPLADTLEELVTTDQAPVVRRALHPEGRRRARDVAAAGVVPREADQPALAERLAGVRFAAGFGKTLSKLLQKGIGVHHAGMLPRYRRLVEQLAQAGLLTVICGTDTLGVGINVPIRTVLFTGLAKFDGSRQRILRTREFLQIAGRAGRAGFDTAGYVVVQAPEHVIENERAKAKSAAKNAALSAEASQAKSQGPAEEAARGHRRLDRADLRQARRRRARAAGLPDEGRQRDARQRPLPRGGRVPGAAPAAHRQPRGPRASSAGSPAAALRLARSLLRSGILTRLDEPDEFGRRYVLTVDLPDDFALNQPLAHFALAALDVLDPEAETYTLDVVSVIEAVLEPPRQILWAQQHEARGEAIAEMKADGIEYDERMRLLEEVTWPQPLAELLEATYETLPREPPVAGPGGARAEVGRPGDVGAGDGLHRLRRPLPAGPVRGAGAALPHRRLPHAAPDRPREAPPAGARRPGRVAGGDGPPDRLLAARRVGGAGRPRARPRRRGPPRAAAAAAADLGAGPGRSA